MTLLFYSSCWHIFGKCKPDINYYKTNPYVSVLFFNFYETEQDTATYNNFKWIHFVI